MDRYPTASKVMDEISDSSTLRSHSLASPSPSNPASNAGTLRSDPAASARPRMADISNSRSTQQLRPYHRTSDRTNELLRTRDGVPLTINDRNMGNEERYPTGNSQLSRSVTGPMNESLRSDDGYPFTPMHMGSYTTPSSSGHMGDIFRTRHDQPVEFNDDETTVVEQQSYPPRRSDEYAGTNYPARRSHTLRSRNGRPTLMNDDYDDHDVRAERNPLSPRRVGEPTNPRTQEPPYSMASRTRRDMNDTMRSRDEQAIRVNDDNTRGRERSAFPRTHRPLNESMRSMTMPRPYPITSRMMQDTIRAGIHDGVRMPINVQEQRNVARTFTSPAAAFPLAPSQTPLASSGPSRLPTAFPPSSEAPYIPSGPARSLRPPLRSEPPYQPTNSGETIQTSLRQAPPNITSQELATSTQTNSDPFTPAIRDFIAAYNGDVSQAYLLSRVVSPAASNQTSDPSAATTEPRPTVEGRLFPPLQPSLQAPRTAAGFRVLLADALHTQWALITTAHNLMHIFPHLQTQAHTQRLQRILDSPYSAGFRPVSPHSAPVTRPLSVAETAMAQQSVVALLDTMDELLPWLRDGDEQGWAMQEMEETALGGIAGVRNEERKDEKRKGGALGWMKRRMGLGREKGEEGEEEEDMAGWGKRYKAKVEEMTQTARRAEKVRAAVERFAAKVADGEHAPQRESYF